MKPNKLKYPKNKKAKLNYGSSILPNVWLYSGIIITLGCLGYFAYRYQQINTTTQTTDKRPSLDNQVDVDNINSETVTKEKLSPEELSIAADLDNINVILEEMEQSASQQNFISVKDISQEKKQKLSKFSSKIKQDSGSDLLKTSQSNTSLPSLSPTIERSSVKTVIQSSSSKNQIPSLSRGQDLHSTDNNSKSDNSSLNSVGKLDRQKPSSPESSLTNNYQEPGNTVNSNNLNYINNQNGWRSLSEFRGIVGSTSTPVDPSPSVTNLTNATQLPTGKLRDYQIQLQDYNRLVPRNYSAQPRTNLPYDRTPANNLGSYQLQSPRLDRVEVQNPALNTTNLPQYRGFSSPINQSNSNNLHNSGLQPSAALQPSNALFE